MMHGRGRRIVLYAGAQNEAPVDEHVALFSEKDRRKHFDQLLHTVKWDATAPGWKLFNKRAVAALKKRLGPTDIVLLTGGLAQRPILEAFPKHQVVEWAVGYDSLTAHRAAFPSHAWRHYIYGKLGMHGRAYDEVIPHFFDPSLFALETKTDDLLFVGRLTAAKGPHVASEIAKALGRRLVVAGPGAQSVTPLEGGGVRIVAEGVTLEGAHLEYAGMLDAPARAARMGAAAAVIVPTLYVEPFGKVAVEAMLAGTPAVTSDWGAFVETVEPGLTGYRFRTLQEGVDAVEDALTLRPAEIQKRATKRFSLAAIGPRYETWFTRLDELWGEGWYSRRDHQ
jgi:glycosyltransferase involved in cell wall biosynthesis